MTPDAQRTAIAEATGHRWYWDRWSSDAQGNWQLNLAYPPQEGIAFPATQGLMAETRAATPEEVAEAKCTRTFICRIPDYLNSLDAMHEVEKTLVHYQIGAYQDWVCRLTPNPPEHVGGFFSLIHAAATYRAEAFLRTLGLWIEP